MRRGAKLSSAAKRHEKSPGFEPGLDFLSPPELVCRGDFLLSLSGVYLDADAHCRGDGDSLDVGALHRSGARLDDGAEQGLDVPDEVLDGERSIAHRVVGDGGLVDAELYAAGLDLFDGILLFLLILVL